MKFHLTNFLFTSLPLYSKEAASNKVSILHRKEQWIVSRQLAKWATEAILVIKGYTPSSKLFELQGPMRNVLVNLLILLFELEGIVAKYGLYSEDGHVTRPHSRGFIARNL